MKVQYLSSGSTVVVYGDPMPYQSPLRITENLPSLVIYVDNKTSSEVGRVYRTSDDRWYLSTVYINNRNPIEVFAKYKAFLFLQKLHANHEH
jgi:hypothetical protein